MECVFLTGHSDLRLACFVSSRVDASLSFSSHLLHRCFPCLCLCLCCFLGLCSCDIEFLRLIFIDAVQYREKCSSIYSFI